MADDLAAERARNSQGFVAEHPPEGKPDPLLKAVQAHNRRLNHERVSENDALDAAQRKAFQGEAPKAPHKGGK
jgi:hypothetical protein